MITLILILPAIVLIVGFYFLIRNELVYRFRMKLIDKIFESEDYHDKLFIYKKVSYDYMLYHKWWKPLKLSLFFSEPEIEFLTK